VSFGDGQHTVRKPAGHIIIVQPEGPPVELDTLQCVHCMKHWRVRPGSGIRRGWCARCNGPVCGKQDCMQRCVPFEAKVLGEAQW
jgi:hypothetical protein